MILCSKISHMIEGNGDRHLVQMVLDDDGQTLGQLGDPAVAKMAELDLHGKAETMAAEKGVSYTVKTSGRSSTFAGLGDRRSTHRLS